MSMMSLLLHLENHDFDYAKVPSLHRYHLEFLSNFLSQYVCATDLVGLFVFLITNFVVGHPEAQSWLCP